MVKPVLYLIPPLGHDSKFYDLVSSSLTEQYDVVLADYPYRAGVNEINWESNNLLVALAAYFVKEIELYLEETNRTLYGIGGVSLGGTLSILMYDLLQVKPLKMFLISSGGLRVPSLRKRLIQRAVETTSTRDLLRLTFALDGENFENSSFRRQFQVVSAEVEGYWHYYTSINWREERFSNAGNLVIKILLAAVEVDFEKYISRLSERIVVVWGEKDKIFSMRAFDKFKKLAEDAEFHLLDGVGHYSPIESPDAVSRIILGKKSA